MNIFQSADDLFRWEQFSPLKKQGIFLQSVHQKELYERLGQKTWLLSLGKGKEEIRSLVTKVEAKRGTFLFLPYGPLFVGNSPNWSHLQEFFKHLKNLAKEEKASFIRASPYWSDTEKNQKIFKLLKFRQSPIHMLAETLWILDFQKKTEEELLTGMEKKHRNLTRRASKEGVLIKKSTDPESVQRFIHLHQQTVQRHQFTPYPKEYFSSQVKFFSKENQVLVFEACWKNEVLASAIIMFYGNAAAYHHGASSSQEKHRKIPASYLLQWEAIREAMRRNCDQYNFWGIAPDHKLRHPFYGITHFKTGFGGKRVDLLPAQDLVISKKYYLNWMIEKARKWRRGF